MLKGFTRRGHLHVVGSYFGELEDAFPPLYADLMLGTRVSSEGVHVAMYQTKELSMMAITHIAPVGGICCLAFELDVTSGRLCPAVSMIGADVRENTTFLYTSS